MEGEERVGGGKMRKKIDKKNWGEKNILYSGIPQRRMKKQAMTSKKRITQQC